MRRSRAYIAVADRRTCANGTRATVGPRSWWIGAASSCPLLPAGGIEDLWYCKGIYSSGLWGAALPLASLSRASLPGARRRALMNQLEICEALAY
jgi:hypothetical protein